MCGIFGFWLNGEITDDDISLGKQGVAALKHRGPDHQNFWVNKQKGLFLGHARLSIIDVSAQSHQPMERGNHVISYNGEIYNFQELARKIQSDKITLQTSGDTEVLLQSWMHWGPQCLNDLDGMFAFALYDHQRLHLVVDPFGEKPLYWAQTNDGLYFSSEPEPLVSLLNLTPNFSDEDIATFLSLGFMPSPKTGFQNLYRIPPGTHQTWSSPHNKTEYKYWQPNPTQIPKDSLTPLSESALDKIAETLTDSLRVRLRADVPLGLFLSSGVDSILIAALTKKELQQDVQTYTVKFSDAEVADESGIASQVTKHLQLPHTIIHSDQDPARTDPNVIFDLFGEANDNITTAAAYQMSLVASKSLKVALTGMGGDEMFYGYNKYQQSYRWRHWLKLPESLRQIISSYYPSFFPKRWHNLITLLSAKDAQRFLATKNTPFFHWLKRLPAFDTISKSYFGTYNMPIELVGRHFDLIHTMPDTFIPAMERASMRASIEIRTPFLNRKLYETLSNYDQRALIAFGSKSVLRRILKRYVPERITQLPKQGFNYPQSTFLSHFQNQPNIPQLPQKLITQAWQQKDNPSWRSLLVRLCILDHFQNTATYANQAFKIQHQSASCRI